MGRAANGAGTLSQRKDGLWQVQVRRDGKRLSFYGRTRSVALKKAEQPKPSKETLHGFLAHWLDKRRGTVRASTWRRYETTVRNSLIPHLPDMRLGALTTSHIEQLNEETLGSASAAHKARVVLGTALQCAVNTHRIPGNPCHSRVLRLPVARREYLDPSTVTKHHFANVLGAAGLPPMQLHDLRHTFITHALEDGVMPHTPSEIVGHSSAAFTLSRYASVTRGMHDSAVEATNRRYASS